MLPDLIFKIGQGNYQSLARAISLIENEAGGFEQLLESLPYRTHTGIIGITGPPGAGKSTLVDALIREIIKEHKKIGVICVDPSSPFTHGALLGDRIRMTEWYNHPHVFIRSLASRESFGGLHPRIIEICDLMNIAPFDYIIIETVGVGQSEVEIAGLADITIVVLVPEGGDEIQGMKAGLMEIGDIFVVNKSDRPNADIFVNNVRSVLSPAMGIKKEIPVLKTIANQSTGVPELLKKLEEILSESRSQEKKMLLLTEKAFHLIGKKRMKEVSKEEILERIITEMNNQTFNLYRIVMDY